MVDAGACEFADAGGNGADDSTLGVARDGAAAGTEADDSTPGIEAEGIATGVVTSTCCADGAEVAGTDGIEVRVTGQTVVDL